MRVFHTPDHISHAPKTFIARGQVLQCPEQPRRAEILKAAVEQILCRRTVTGTVRFWSFLSPDTWRSPMKSSNPSIPTRDTENDAVIFVSIELSKKSWLAAIHTPLADKIALHKVEAGDSAGLLALVRRLMTKVERAMSGSVKVLSCYEAGYDGFWLHRVLVEAGIGNHVIDPASLQVNRRARRAKTDRIDALGMVRALMAFERGEDQVS